MVLYIFFQKKKIHKEKKSLPAYIDVLYRNMKDAAEEVRRKLADEYDETEVSVRNSRIL